MPRTVHIILTADYEIFGDGSGDVRRSVIEPTAQILELCEKYSAPMTLFFEVGEYWAFLREREKLIEDLGCDPAALMEEQGRAAHSRGHDLQLHLHPQWLEAKYENKKWILNMDHWRLPKLPLGAVEEESSITGALYRGKQTLEGMLQPVNPAYACLAFRAGALCIQPSADFHQAAKTVGLRIDSSVSKGYVNLQPPSLVDFREAHHRHRPWYADPMDIIRPGVREPNGLLEVPIASIRQPVIKQISLSEVLTHFRGAPKDNAVHPSPSAPMSFPSRLRRLFTPVYTGWDFGLPSGRRLVKILEKLIRDCDQPVNPLVMIGHPKTFFAPHGFEGFLRLTKEKFIDVGRAQFSTFPEFLKAYEGRT